MGGGAMRTRLQELHDMELEAEKKMDLASEKLAKARADVKKYLAEFQEAMKEHGAIRAHIACEEATK